MAAENQTIGSFERQIVRTIGYKYLLSLPTGYDAEPGRRWPVLLFLHGGGERGTDPWLVAQHGPPKLIRGPVAAPATTTTRAAAEASTETVARRETAARMLKEQFIVVSPQCPEGASWDDVAVLALLDEILAQHRADASRVYLTGLSLGGYGTWSVGLKNPQRFAAIVPVCGGGQRRDIRTRVRENKSVITSLGVWAFHGAKDATVPIEESEVLVNDLRRAGNEVRFTVYPDAGHDSWTQTYANPDLYAWMLQHRRTGQ
jgi:predicted peptidase